MFDRTAKIAFLGTGIMGFQMARRLCEAGNSLTAWNRSRNKAQPLEQFGATVADAPEAAVRDAGLVICMLADYKAGHAVYFDGNVLDAIAPGTLLIDMATYAPAESLELAEAAKRRGVRFIDAPVSGGERGAAAGTLSIMAGGTEQDVKEAEQVLKVCGRVTHVGPAGTGSVAKLCNQLIVGNTVVAVAEALNLAGHLGADPGAVRQALLGGFADSVILKEHGERMLEQNFEPGGPAIYMQQILVTAKHISEEKQVPLPLARVSETLFTEMIAAGQGGLDLSAVIRQLKE